MTMIAFCEIFLSLIVIYKTNALTICKVLCTGNQACIVKYSNGNSLSLMCANAQKRHDINGQCSVTIEGFPIDHFSCLFKISIPMTCNNLEITSFQKTGIKAKRYKPLNNKYINGQYRLISMCKSSFCQCYVFPETYEDILVYNPFGYSLTLNGVYSTSSKNISLQQENLFSNATLIEGSTNVLHQVYILSKEKLWIYCGESPLDIFVQTIPYTLMYTNGLDVSVDTSKQKESQLFFFSHEKSCNVKFQFGLFKEWNVNCNLVSIKRTEFKNNGTSKLLGKGAIFIVWRVFLTNGTETELGFELLTRPFIGNLPWPDCGIEMCSTTTLQTNIAVQTSSISQITGEITKKTYASKSHLISSKHAFTTATQKYTENITLYQIYNSKQSIYGTSNTKSVFSPTTSSAYTTVDKTEAKNSMSIGTKNYSFNGCPKHCFPVCQEVPSGINITHNIKIIQNKNQLNKNNLSKTLRQLTSAKDDRISARIMGYIGVIVILIVFGFICFIDCLNVIQYVCSKNMRLINLRYRRPSTVDIITRHQHGNSSQIYL